jgi:hypothetical protein
MADPARFPLDLSRPAAHVEVSPGGEIVLRGSYQSTHDGSVIDAATTTWPREAPGGGSVDPGGLIDFERGGLHMTSRDPVTHEVHAVATGEAGSVCAAAGVASPCLPLRLSPLGNSRLLTADAWRSSLKGGIAVEVPVPPIYAPAAAEARGHLGLIGGTLAALGLALAGAVLWKQHKLRQASPRAQLLALARRVQLKATRADPVVAAPLAPALEAAFRRLESGRIDPTSAEGKRVSQMLRHVDQRLDATEQRLQSQEQQRAADELVREVEIALEAGEETLALDQRQGRLAISSWQRAAPRRWRPRRGPEQHAPQPV